MPRPTVLICGDKRADAVRLRNVLETDGQLSVVGISPNGRHALASLERLRPAIVAIDLQPHGMTAVRTIGEIVRRHAIAVVALTDAGGGSQAEAALAAGAVEVWPRVLGTSEARQRVAALRRLIAQPAAPQVPLAGKGGRPGGGRGGRPREVQVIGIGASTGGPRALRGVLCGLPAGYPIPLLVVQHMAAGFVDGLANWLDSEIALPVAVAAAGVRAERGVWLAPDGAHLTIDAKLRIVLEHGPAVGGHRPSADVLLNSMAGTLGAATLAVVLTGMGADGAAGVRAVIAAGGRALAQDEASCVVYGMPREAGRGGAQTMTVDALSQALQRLGRAGESS